MRYLVISDVHSNFLALQTVINDARPFKFEAVLSLGDLVGYGPNPNECIERLQDFEYTAIVGNHDWGVLGRADYRVFNTDARISLFWTRDELTAENQRFLADLPLTVRLGDMLLCHGSPREPVWEYLVDTASAEANFRAEEFQLALVGHTHLPVAFEWLPQVHQARLLLPDWEMPMELAGRRLIINPGSVGQPRNGDPRACYGILDTDAQTFLFRRVAYPVEIIQERMRARGLPQRLIDRLELGR